MTTIYTVNNKVLKNSANDKWLIKKAGLPPIPENKVRVRTNNGEPPSNGAYTSATLVVGTTDIYDVGMIGTSYNSMFASATNIIEVLGANLPARVTNLMQMFSDCTSLTSVSLFDTSNVTNMSNMFYNCSSLTSVPLFNTSSVTKMGSMFKNCINVESGALALYQQASTQTTPPTSHSGTFKDCGSNTTAGAAELAQIPSNWK